MSDKQLPDGIEWPRFEDGELVKIGDYIIDHGNGPVVRVKGIHFNEKNVTITSEKSWWYHYENTFEKRPPVLDKDGKEIKVGDTVWQEEDGTELRVIYFGHKEDGEHMVGVERISGPTDWAECRSLSLTHTPPDSWEKLWEDVKRIDESASMCAYVEAEGRECKDCSANEYADCAIYVTQDILHRAEKLAGVSEDV